MTMTRRSRQILTKFNVKGYAFTKLRNLDLRTSDDKDEQLCSFDSSQNVPLQRHDTKQVKTNTKQQRLTTNEVADTQNYILTSRQIYFKTPAPKASKL